jgi:hypothetical protein
MQVPEMPEAHSLLVPGFDALHNQLLKDLEDALDLRW